MNYVELTEALIGCNFVGDENRLDIVLEFLKLQDIDEVCELARFPPAHTLVGANLLLEGELAAIDRVARDQTVLQRIKRARADFSEVVEDAPIASASVDVVSADVKIDVFCQQRSLLGTMGARCGPMQSIKQVHAGLGNEAARLQWSADARMETILGSCSASLKSVKSGIRCYLSFAEKFLLKLGKKLPPTVDELLAYSTHFRCRGTFSNYLGYLRVGCLADGESTAAFDDPAVARAKKAVGKRGNFITREKMFVRLADLQRIMESCYIAEEFDERFCMLFLIAYIFLLRLPSEALPIVRGGSGFADYGRKHKAVLSLEDNSLQLRLSHRKNVANECVLKRPCWCKSADFLVCPVHVVWPYIQDFKVGQYVFEGISPSAANKTLRRYLSLIGKLDAMKYRSHDLRRGHADDLRISGASLWVILTAGQWSSPAFLKYLDTATLEADAVLQAHLDESSDGEEDIQEDQA